MRDLTNGLVYKDEANHYITFGDFDSRRYNLHLHRREAPTPEERPVTATVPYRQGVIDQSFALDYRIYDNRSITYTFYRTGVKMGQADGYQTAIENQLMCLFNTPLYDSYTDNFYYVGKCVSVLCEDDYEMRRLMVEIEFDLYPFKISDLPEGNDIWDTFNFELDYFQETRFDLALTGNQEFKVTLYNPGQVTVQPKVVCTFVTTGTSSVKVTTGGVSGTYYNGTAAGIPLKPGAHQVTIKPNMAGTVTSAELEFVFFKELI